MKKILLGSLLVLFALSSLFLVGCGGDDDDDNNGNNVTNPPDIDTNLDYMVMMVQMSEEYRDGIAQILVYYANDVDPINTLTLTVNGTEVSMETYLGFWYGSCPGITEGQTCAVNAVINGTSYNASVAAAYIPSVNWPDEWDPTASHALTWTMGGSNMYQLFSGASTWYDEEYNQFDDDAETDLASSARSYTVPANWLDSGEYENSLDFTLMEMNWATSGRFAVITSAGDEMEYGDDYWRTTDKREIARDMLDKLLPVIK